MTSTAERVYEALVCDDAFTTDLGGDSAWADILADEVPLATASAVFPPGSGRRRTWSRP